MSDSNRGGLPDDASAEEQAEHLRENDEPVQETTIGDTADVLDEYSEDVSSSPEQRARRVEDGGQ
ncbi:hypothetical protein SAMN04489806_2689 [Paramicrobacterium humi]|uniref:Uncharacterized protein n=1 Tax=Paramicrobacterium humi TaxID=640635 RepID=A0A1H4Q2Q1_9MICO|nr:hypothetical protein [Microbacterium humi]SEC13702.1 hypothetical protein SAMN04489806_2689 [Microbacterium humi]